MPPTSPALRGACATLWLCAALLGTAKAAPSIEQWTSGPGVRTLFVAAPELPMLDIAVTFGAGSDRDAQLGGLSQLTHGLLSAGSEAMDADTVAEKFEEVGARYGYDVNLDYSRVSLRSLTEERLLEQALSTFVEILTRPSFPQKDFMRLKNQALTAIRDEQQRPDRIAGKAFYQAVYGTHPYAQPVAGNESSVQAIALADVQAFQRRYLVAENAVIAIVGALDTDQARRISEYIASRLPRGARPVPVPPPQPTSASQYRYIPYPSQQSHVFLGQLGIARGDPDYFILYTGNHVLGGGGFSSRLMKKIRKQLGLSYSVYSYFFPLQQKGTYTLGLQTRTDQAQQALDQAQQLVQDFVDEGPSEEELELAKKSIIGGFPLRVDQNSDILAYLSLIGYYDLPLDYLDTFTAHIAGVTQADVRAAFRRHLHTDRMVKIVVGGPEKE